MLKIDRALINIVLLGIGFLFLYASFNPVSTINKVIYSTIHEQNKNFTAEGYYVFATIYISLAISNWLAPSIISIIGPKSALVIAAILYSTFAFALLIPQNELMYIAAAFNGFGAALLWVGNGIIMTVNSNEKTVTRNAGLFWAMMQLGQMSGQIFVYCEFRNVTTISKMKRIIVYSSLGILAIISIPFFISINILKDRYKNDIGALAAFKRSFQLLTVKAMILLLLPITFSGLVITFYYGVYSTAIGFTMKFGNKAKEYMALYGIFFGCGSAVGGIILGIFGTKINRWGRYPVLFIGMAIFIISFLLIFLNTPKDSSMMETNDDAIIPSTCELAMFCGFFLGLGDSIFNTQIIGVISVLFLEDCSSAYALFRFLEAVVGAIAFVYSTHLNLCWQLCILTFFAITGSISFYFVDQIYEESRFNTTENNTNPSKMSINL